MTINQSHFKCGWCSWVFKTPQELHEHIKQNHLEESREVNQIPYIQEADEYQAWAEKTKSVDYRAIADRFGIGSVINEDKFKRIIDLLHGILGIISEAGELADPLKKHLYYGTGKHATLDIKNMREETGDLIWYPAACIASALDTSLSELMNDNINKLAKRYPEQVFKENDAIKRADKECPECEVTDEQHKMDCSENDRKGLTLPGDDILGRAVCPECEGLNFQIIKRIGKTKTELQCSRCGKLQ